MGGFGDLHTTWRVEQVDHSRRIQAALIHPQGVEPVGCVWPGRIGVSANLLMAERGFEWSIMRYLDAFAIARI